LASSSLGFFGGETHSQNLHLQIIIPEIYVNNFIWIIVCGCN